MSDHKETLPAKIREALETLTAVGSTDRLIHLNVSTGTQRRLVYRWATEHNLAARTEYRHANISHIRCHHCFQWNRLSELKMEGNDYQYLKDTAQSLELPSDTLTSLFDASPLDASHYTCPQCNDDTYYAWDDPDPEDVRRDGWRLSDHIIVYQPGVDYKGATQWHGGPFRRY